MNAIVEKCPASGMDGEMLEKHIDELWNFLEEKKLTSMLTKHLLIGGLFSIFVKGSS